MASGYQPPPTVDHSVVERVIRSWDFMSARVARAMVNKYGPPHEAASFALVWYYNDPWERTIVWRDGYRHNFPKPHVDIIEQTLAYKIPKEIIRELVSYNGSLTINRTRGHMTVCCANEGMNFLVMNLAHEIILGRLSGQDAKERHREVVAGHRLHWPESYMEGLQFTVVAQPYGVDESTESGSNIPSFFRQTNANVT